MQLSSVIYVSSGFVWNVTNSTFLTINTFKDQLIQDGSTILPSWNLKDNDFSLSLLNKNNTEISNNNSSVLLKPPPNLALLFNQFNNSSTKQNIDPENVVNSRYFHIDQIKSFKFPQKEKPLSFFPINERSLSKNFDDSLY